MAAIKPLKKKRQLALLFAVMMLVLAIVPAFVFAADVTPAHKTLDELKGKRFAYVNGSVYNQSVQKRLEDIPA